MNNLLRIGACIAVGSTVAACSGLPDRIDTLEQARQKVQTLQQDPLASDAAATDIEAARNAIRAADDAYASKDDLKIIEHDAYLADGHANIAEQRIAQAHAEKELEQSRADRDRVRLEARERETQRAQAQADVAQAQAAEAQEQAADANAQSARLQQRLDALQAKKTDQGLVLTLGDVLFDTAQADLKSGAMPTIDRLAGFMRDYPDRRVLVEGYTDSRGSDTFNLQLSQRRAQAVADALVQQGIATTRVQKEGLGEAYPVASNDTTAGMQQNRRVEIVISDEDGKFPNAVQHRLAAAPTSGG
jgi:outer membrane protein OmpA-like peptidoglycan-associated protein